MKIVMTQNAKQRPIAGGKNFVLTIKYTVIIYSGGLFIGMIFLFRLRFGKGRISVQFYIRETTVEF